VGTVGTADADWALAEPLGAAVAVGPVRGAGLVAGTAVAALWAAAEGRPAPGAAAAAGAAGVPARRDRSERDLEQVLARDEAGGPVTGATHAAALLGKDQQRTRG